MLGLQALVHVPSLAVPITQPGSLLSKVKPSPLRVDSPTLTLPCKHGSPFLPWPASLTPPF